MKQQMGKLGIREYIAIMILVVGSKATEDTPTSLYNSVQSSAWMIPILSGLFFLIPLFLLLKTMSLFKDKNLFEVIRILLGKYVGFFVCLITFLISLLAFSFDTRTYTEIIGSLYFPNSPRTIIYFILLLVSIYGAKKGIVAIGSVAYLSVLVIIVSFAIVLIVSQKDGYIQSIFPIWGTGKVDLLKESTLRLNLYSDLIISALLIPLMKSNKDFQKGTLFSFFFAIFFLSYSIFSYLCLFDRSMSSIGYPLHTLIRLIQFGTFMTNIEILFLPIWLATTFIRCAANLYITTFMFGQIFKVKEFEHLIPAMAAIFFLIGMIPETPLDLALEIKPLIRNLSGVPITSIPIILWLVALLRGKFKHPSKEKSV